MKPEDESAVLNQALGMITVQADCDIPAAIRLLEARAAADGQRLIETARAVVDRRTDFYRSS